MDELNYPKKPTLLVVDDTPANLALMNALLKKDYKVKVADSGDKALKIALSDLPPDLILLDIMMPGMDGYELCRQLKRDARTKNIPVIFVTAKSEMADEEKGLELGAIDYITTPFRPPIFMARVKNHLALNAMADFLCDQNDWNTAERLALALKGLSHNVGLQQLAEQLETAIKARRSRDEVDARINGPTHIAQMTLAPDEHTKAPATGNLEKLEAVCRELESLLLDGDTEAVEVMDANAELLNAAFPNHGHDIDNQIRSLNFEAALLALRDATGKTIWENQRTQSSGSRANRRSI